MSITTTAKNDKVPIRYESLDVWRGFACLIIVIVHSMSFAGSEYPRTTLEFSEPRDFWEWLLIHSSVLGVGVYIFFVVSGYCITAAVQNGITKKLSFGKYLYRRFRRIYFPYWIFLILMVLWVNGINRPELFQVKHTRIRLWEELGMWQWFGNITLTELWRSYFIGDHPILIAGHLWTLGYEEQFYLVAGLMFWLIPQRYYLGVIVVSIGTIVARVGMKYRGWEISGFFFDGHWLIFAIGIGVYFAIHQGSKSWRLGYMALLMVCALGFIFGPFRESVRMQYISSTIFGLVLLLLHPFDLAIRRAWFLIPLVWCGQMCYSLYLLHFPIVITISNGFREAGYSDIRFHWLVVMPICVLVSLVLSRVFYHLVEKRFMNTPPPKLLLSSELKT